MSSERFDIALVGGGLANTLIALRLAERHPELTLAIVEREPRLGGDHTWSFHETDLTAQQMAWMAPLVVHSWPRQSVRFAGFSRTLDIGYRSVTSQRLHAVATKRLGDAVKTGSVVTELGAAGLRLADGRAIEAGAVIDGRGPSASADLTLGWQKFVGREVLTKAPHGLDAPVIMDATVPQIDGYRFVYLLPFAPDRMLIEDTYYSDEPGLDDAAIGGRIEAYAAAQGWRIRETLREERGVLPIALGGDIDAFWARGGQGIARAGLKAALFHPTTGYALPDAVALGDVIAGLDRFDGASVRAASQAHSKARWSARGGFRFLNRMMFRAAKPDERWRLLERFYRLPEGLIARFYADRLTLADRARILTGRPPVPLSRALACLVDTSGSKA